MFYFVGLFGETSEHMDVWLSGSSSFSFPGIWEMFMRVMHVNSWTLKLQYKNLLCPAHPRYSKTTAVKSPEGFPKFSRGDSPASLGSSDKRNQSHIRSSKGRYY